MSDYINKLPQGVRVYTDKHSFKDEIELAKSLGFFKGGNILNSEKENKED